MTFGFNVYSDTGSLTYTTDDVTWNQVDFYYHGAGASTVNNYPILIAKDAKAVQVLINAPSLNSRSVAKNIYVDNGNGNVYVSGGTEAAYILVLMR